MNRYLLLLFCLFMLNLSSHAEFRVWRNTEGKSVTAEFKGMKDDKAVLLREDGKEFLLSPDTLCEEDQSYIQEKLSAPDQVAKEETEQTEETPHISKSEAKVIAEKYAEAVKNNDVVALQKLIWKSDDPERVWNTGKVSALPCRSEIKNIRIKSVKEKNYGYEVELQVVTKENGNTYEQKGFVQMLKDGKIKYDTMGLLHPYEHVSFLMQLAFIREKSPGNLDMNNQEILELDIPLFGYEEAKSDGDRIRALKKVIKWLRDEGEEWDETEPRVPCQKDVFKYWVEELRSVENS